VTKEVEALSAFGVPGLAFLLMLAFGLWLSRVGRPYNGLLFNIHKLLALGAVVVTAVQFSGMLKNAGALALIIACSPQRGRASSPCSPPAR
jgi:hypothetical protein